MAVLNKMDLLAPGRLPTLPSGGPALRLSARSGEGLAGFRAEVRARLMTSPGVCVLRIPLDEPEAVQLAVGLPHQVARRFREEFLDLAVRADGNHIRELGLGAFLTEGWE